jgi:methyl-accepting chemotaxis protein PixJ
MVAEQAEQFQEALQAYVDGQYEVAMREFSELLYEDPSNPTLLIWLGASLRKAGKIEYAKLQYQQVLSITEDPDLVELAQTALTQIQEDSSGLLTSSAKPPQRGKPITLEEMGTEINPKLNGQVANIMTTSSESVTKTDNSTSVSVDVGFINMQPSLLPPPLPTLPKRSPKSKKAANAKQLNKNISKAPNTDQLTDPDLSQLPKISTVIGQGHNGKPAPLPFAGLSVKNGEVSPKTERAKPINESNKPSKFELKTKPDKSFNQADKSVALSDSDDLPDAFSSQTSVLKFSSIKLKITAWAIALATIPAIAIGGVVYYKGSSNFANQVRQTKGVEVTSLADSVSRFMAKQHENVSLLGTLLVSSEPNKVPAANPAPTPALTPAQQKQVIKDALTNRLNLYKQAYVSFDSIAIFDSTGNQLAQSAGTPTPHILDKDFLKQVVAANSLLISKPMLAEQEYVINFAIPIKDPTSQKVSTILQARMPVKNLLENLKASGSSISVIDSMGRYVVGTEGVRTGTDATADFANLAEIRTDFQSKGTASSDRGPKLLAYAPLPKFASTSLDWDVLTSTDKNAALSPNQLLLLLAAIGIGLTPLLVGIVAYVLSNQLSTRLKSIDGAVRQITKGKLRTRVIVDGNDELAELSLGINKMTEEFQTMLKNHRLENERLQNQVLRLFKTLVQLAKIDENSLDVSDQSIGVIVNRVQSQMARKEAELVQHHQEKEHFRKQLMQIVAQVKDLSKGDLTVSNQMVDGDIGEVSRFFGGVIDNLRQIVTHVKTASAQVNQSLGHNQQAITQLSDEALKQAEQISRTLNAAQMMNVSAQKAAQSSSQVIEINDNTAQNIDAGNKAIDLTMQGILNLRSTVTATAKKVKRLGESSQQISKVVSLINDIAVQTNFLSINASLEAARAGESGKGFALVAEEVGRLAARSTAAIKEVEHLIGNIQVETSEVMSAIELGTSQVKEGTQLVEDVQKSLQQISNVSHQIDQLVSSISDATGSQAATSECIANLMKDISQVSGRTASSSTKVSKSLQTSVKLAEQLQKSVDRFKVS